MKLLRIGVIGVGHMGRNHVRILSEEKRFDLIGIFDTDHEQAAQISDRYNTRAFKELDELLELTDAVIIAVPSSLHREVALHVADRGVHALVEKPLATIIPDAEDIVRAFDEYNLKLAVGHIERFNPVFRELKKLSDPRDIIYIEACRYSPHSGSGRITDTSVVEDLMIHDVDLVCALMDDMPTSIHGRGEAISSKMTDFATCLMDFGGHAHAVVNASRVSQDKERTITVHMPDKCIRADLLAKTLEIYKSTNLTIDLSRENSYVQDSMVQRVYVPIMEPLREELISFYDSVIGGGPVEVNGQVGINALKICEIVAERAAK